MDRRDTYERLRRGWILLLTEDRRRRHLFAAWHLVPLDGLEARALGEHVLQNSEEGERLQGAGLATGRQSRRRYDSR